MMRYRLDDLGWYQFEWLIQSLLKAELGIGIESWGGRHDYGRDAYIEDDLNFPSKHLVSSGPFLFQMKFVENANAPGSHPEANILASVRKESSEIQKRLQSGRWKPIAHYALYTNADLTANLKGEICNILSTSLSNVRIHPMGGKDVCDILDQHPSLRKSFPQLLSLRDLDTLLSEVVNRSTIEKSKSAIDSARDVVPVFVPTQPYERAWVILKKYGFAVLEGPPEMGKTAIAWMIAIAQLSQGWEALVCDEPEEFFQVYNSDSKQIFIADDAFGRTEYDPTRTSKWEAQLDKVLRRVDQNHWLIWTSRKHILERAVTRMDLQGKATAFPKSGSVLVNASDLSIKDKALILYRHVRTASLEEQAKALVKKQAEIILSDPHFTPERIRRFVNEVLPSLDLSTMQQVDRYIIAEEIRETIRNPTERMRKSFKALEKSQKWLLISFLEGGYRPSVETIQELYDKYCPPEDARPFMEVLNELTEAFIK